MVGGGSENVAVFWYLDGRALDWLGQTGPGRGVQVRTMWFSLIYSVAVRRGTE